MEKIYSMFLRLMTDYKHLLFTEQEMNEEFVEILENALIEVQIKGALEDLTFTNGQFNRELATNEQYILAHACVLIWVQPMVNSAELLAAQLTSTDYSQFSNSNRLSAAIRLHNSISTKLYSLLSEYDCRVSFKALKKKLGD